MVRTHLLCIDPQNDFCDPKGSLYVNGADDDMKRLAAFVTKSQKKLFDIHVTLDSHHLFQVFHPLFWRNVAGDHPAPFTRITEDDILKSVWFPVVPGMRDRMLAYVKALAAANRYQLIIWPPHCLIGTWGTSVNPALASVLADWENANAGMVDYVTKGSNLYTEHYSAVKAEVPDPADASTQLNQTLVDILQEADIILVAGEALDYCLINSLRDIVTAFGPDNAKKIVLLKDCTSAIDPSAADKIYKEMESWGAKISDTTYFDK
jgi:nicotinamidase-related amidase